MGHRRIILEHRDGTGDVAPVTNRTASYKEALEKAVVELSVVSPRIFRFIKSQAVRDLTASAHVRDLGESQMFVLHTLGKNKYLPSELARLHNVTNPTMSRVIDGLVDKGYVERAQDPEDRRCVFLQLTDDGKRIGVEVEHHFKDAMRQFLSPLSEEQLRDIRKAYRHLASLLPEGSVENVENVEAEIEPAKIAVQDRIPSQA